MRLNKRKFRDMQLVFGYIAAVVIGMPDAAAGFSIYVPSSPSE